MMENPPPITKFGSRPDIKFIFPHCNGAAILVDKFMLMNSSEVFKRQFSSSIGDDGAPIIITDIAYEIFDEIMCHLAFPSCSIGFEMDNFVDFLYASRKYFLHDLTGQIIEFAMMFIDEYNVCTYFEQIEKFDIQILNDHMRKICRTFPLDVIQSLTLSASHKRILETILQSAVLPYKEYEIYDYIRNMFTRTTNVSDHENFRKELGHLVYLIRFPTMTPSELLACGESPSLLTPQELVDLQLWVQKKRFSNTMQFFSVEPRYFFGNVRGNSNFSY